jgi:hypothetical protein
MTDSGKLNQQISDTQSTMYARQLEETVKALRNELVVSRQGLADVACVLCPDQVDILTRKKPGSSAATLPLDELVRTMKGAAQTFRLIATNSAKSPGSREEKLLARVTELEGLLRAEKRRADLSERSRALAEQALDSERSRAAKAARGQGRQGGGDRYQERVPASRAVEPSSPPELLAEEKSSAPVPASRPAHNDVIAANVLKEWEEWAAGFEADGVAERREQIKSIVLFVGSTGKTTTSEIVAGTGLDDDKVYKKAGYATEPCGLFLDQKSLVRKPKGGRPKNSYVLSPKGEWYYKLLTNQSAKESEEAISIRADKSGKHLGLKTAIADRFDALRWKVNRKPDRIYLDGGPEYSEPDLIIQKSNQTINIEVETAVHIETESAVDWSTKFTNGYKATGGVLCVVTDKRSRLSTLLGKVNFWLSQSKMFPIFIYATTLEHLEQVGPDESPWIKAEQKTASGQ